MKLTIGIAAALRRLRPEEDHHPASTTAINEIERAAGSAVNLDQLLPLSAGRTANRIKTGESFPRMTDSPKSHSKLE